MTDEECTTDDEFWDAMERKPDYSAFLDRFDGYKNYWRISPDTWARWDQANLKSQSEEAFWALMEHEPDLQAVIGRFRRLPENFRRNMGAVGCSQHGVPVSTS
jgi:hypothetical protein